MLEQTNFAFAVQEFEGKVVSVYAQSGKVCNDKQHERNRSTWAPRFNIQGKHNTAMYLYCFYYEIIVCTVSVIQAISIKALAHALSFSETLHAAFRFFF